VVLVLAIAGGGGYYLLNKSKPVESVVDNQTQSIGQNQEATNSEKMVDITEVNFSEAVKNKMLIQAKKQIILNDSESISILKIIKGSFSVASSTEYILITQVDGPAALIDYFSLYDENLDIKHTYNFSQFTHAYSIYDFYKCESRGVYLMLTQVDSQPNGSYRSTDFNNLVQFMSGDLAVSQQIFKADKDGEVSYVLQSDNNSLLFYKWNIYEYSNKSEYDTSTLGENNCKKPECLSYWNNIPYAKGYLLYTKTMNYNSQTCRFE